MGQVLKGTGLAGRKVGGEIWKVRRAFGSLQHFFTKHKSEVTKFLIIALGDIKRLRISLLCLEKYVSNIQETYMEGLFSGV